MVRGRPSRDKASLTPRQAEIVNFLHEWLGEHGLTFTDPPPDHVLVRAVTSGFVMCKQAAAKFVVELRAAGIFGNPTDERVRLKWAARTAVLNDCLVYLENRLQRNGVPIEETFWVEKLIAKVREVIV